MSETFACFAPCPRGLEALLAAELLALGAESPDRTHGGVAFRGDRKLLMAANLHSRFASRILLQLARARYRSDRDLHRLAAGVAWEDWMSSERTLRVDTRAIRARLQSLNLATLRVKDGIVDRLRERCGRRPDIDTEAPQVRVFCFLDERFATLYLDTSGENLFKRGWRGRHDKGIAPLKENLAAGLLALAGWRPGSSLVDAFCGSGTIAIEAAQQAGGIAPGAARRFGFENLRQHDDACWQAMRTAAASAPGEGPSRIAASDADPAMVRIARANAARAGLADDAISFSTGAFGECAPPRCEPGLLLSNLPYGQRMMTGAGDGQPDRFGPDDLPGIGRRLRAQWSGWRVCLLSSDLKLPGRLALRPARRIPLFNGPIETRLFVFDMR